MAQFESINESIASTPPAAPEPGERIEETSLVEEGKDLTEPGYIGLLKDTFEDLFSEIGRKYEVEMTDELKQKALTELNKKLNEWIMEGTLDLGLDLKIETEKDIELSLMRKGLPNDVKGLRKLISLLGADDD